MYKKKVCLITGGTSGLGEDLSIKLSSQGFKLIVIGKSKQKIDNLKKKIGKKAHDFYVVNLTNLKNVKKFLSRIKNLKKIDLLINNAGGLINERRNIFKSENINLNYLSHIYLTEKLINKIKKSNKRKIVFISSHVHKDIEEFEFTNYNKIYNLWELYKLSKLFLTTYSYILKKNNKSIKVFTINPGRISSNFGLLNDRLVSKLIKIYLFIFGKNTNTVSKKIIRLVEKKLSNQTDFYFNIDRPSKINPICLNKSFQKNLLKFTKSKLTNL